jgi:hypothetical protein
MAFSMLVLGSNSRIDVRWLGSNPQRIQAETTDLIAIKPEVILWHVGCYCSDFATVSESSQVDVI